MQQREAANQLVDSLNVSDDSAIVQVFTHSHRTLQQNVFRMMLNTMRVWAETENYDLRNEATVLLSKRIVAAVGEEAIPFV